MEVPLSEAIHSRARSLESDGLKPLDSFHVACAEAASASHFLTCDDRLIKRDAGGIPILNPVDFILHLPQSPL
jgi:predicted nucleic acid-binding protein